MDPLAIHAIPPMGISFYIFMTISTPSTSTAAISNPLTA